MKISRWTAEVSATPEIIQGIFAAEGLDGRTSTVKSGSKVVNQRAILNEVIQVINGELIFNLSGTQFVLRQGDKLEIPANTSYSFSNMKNEDCTLIMAQKI